MKGSIALEVSELGLMPSIKMDSWIQFEEQYLLLMPSHLFETLEKAFFFLLSL